MRFQDLTSHHWTIFWKGLTSSIAQNDKRIKKYKWSSIKRSFVNVGVDAKIVNNAQTTFNIFREVERQILRFNQFFVGNRDVLQACLGEKDINNTYLKILELFENGDHKAVRSQLDSIRILKQLDRRGEGNEYVSASATTENISSFDSKLLQRRLSRVLNRQYRSLDPIEYRGWTVYPFTMKADWEAYLFIQLQKQSNGTLASKISGSDLEQIIVRSYLAKVFGSYLRSIEVDGDFAKLMEFIQTGGSSEHFVLKGAGFTDSDFIVSVRRKFSGQRAESLGSPPVLKKLKKPDQLDRLSLKHKDNQIVQKPITLSASTFVNAKVVGAIILNFRDRNFRAAQRDAIRDHFKEDFGLPLGAFVRFKEPSEKELCQLFLENEVRKKTARMGVRIESTQRAWGIYGNLAKVGILAPDLEEEIVTSYCFSRSCDMRYKPQDAMQAFCYNCGFPLADKNDITIGAINEESVAKWLKEKAFEHGFDPVRIVKRKILSRTIVILEAEKGNTKMNFMTITTDPSAHFLEVLSARYPDVCVVTSKDNTDAYKEAKVHAVKLYELYDDLEIKNKNILAKNSRKIRQQSRNRISLRAEDALQRLQSDDYYLKKNKIVKNLGAELFEADCHALLQSIFGSSIWLGAKKRGVAVPDGRSAFPQFPSLGIDKACFAWDSKFTTDKRSKMGGPKKNKEYVKQLYEDPDTKGKGARGLVFISNKPEQTTFRSAALKITGKRRVKVVHMQAKHLVSLYQHYSEHSQTIEDNEVAKKAFYTFAKDIFTSTSKVNGGKTLAIDDKSIQEALDKNAQRLNT